MSPARPTAAAEGCGEKEMNRRARHAEARNPFNRSDRIAFPEMVDALWECPRDDSFGTPTSDTFPAAGTSFEKAGGRSAWTPGSGQTRSSLLSWSAGSHADAYFADRERLGLLTPARSPSDLMKRGGLLLDGSSSSAASSSRGSWPQTPASAFGGAVASAGAGAAARLEGSSSSSGSRLRSSHKKSGLLRGWREPEIVEEERIASPQAPEDVAGAGAGAVQWGSGFGGLRWPSSASCGSSASGVGASPEPPVGPAVGAVGVVGLASAAGAAPRLGGAGEEFGDCSGIGSDRASPIDAASEPFSPSVLDDSMGSGSHPKEPFHDHGGSRNRLSALLQACHRKESLPGSSDSHAGADGGAPACLGAPRHDAKAHVWHAAGIELQHLQRLKHELGLPLHDAMANTMAAQGHQDCSAELPLRSLDLSSSSISFGREDARVRFALPPPATAHSSARGERGEAAMGAQASAPAEEAPAPRFGANCSQTKGATKSGKVAEQQLKGIVRHLTFGACEHASGSTSNAKLVRQQDLHAECKQPSRKAPCCSGPFVGSLQSSPGELVDWDSSLSREVTLACAACGSLQKLSHSSAEHALSSCATTAGGSGALASCLGGTGSLGGSGSLAGTGQSLAEAKVGPPLFGADTAAFAASSVELEAPLATKARAGQGTTPSPMPEQRPKPRRSRSLSGVALGRGCRSDCGGSRCCRGRGSSRGDGCGGGEVLLQLRLCPCGQGLAVQCAPANEGGYCGSSSAGAARRRGHQERPARMTMQAADFGCAPVGAPCGPSAPRRGQDDGRGDGTQVKTRRRTSSRRSRSSSNLCRETLPHRRGVAEIAKAAVDLEKLRLTVGALRERYLEDFVLQRGYGGS
mmetsp:Transcript_107738/g.343882  ORF Transcript_107738/g.343882 Transcript_107738/m.343882 type:complete len:861 (+) Transcript_107738:110-2692(+)